MFRGSGTAYERARANVALSAGIELPASERYALQRRYYASNGLYLDLARALYEQGVVNRSIRGLMNPAFRVVEAHVQWMWPGDLPDALPIETENERIIEPIQQVWKWSNWARKKSVMSRWLAMLGDVFIKVARPSDSPRVYFQMIDPAHVSWFETDERDNLVEVRIDIPISRMGDSSRVAERLLHTEVWSKSLQSYRKWEHKNTSETPIAELGVPLEEIPFSQMGINFVPICHAQFMDIGEERGAGSFIFQLDKIDQLNAEATRLSQMMFRHNKPTLVMIGGRDGAGRPLPAPNTANGADVLEMPDESVISVPGATTVESMVPNLDYEAHLKLIEQRLQDLAHDLPEMAYWSIVDSGSSDISGRALNYILGPAINRALEARGNAEDALARANEMALTIASVGDKKLFGNIGTYEQGDFEHSFESRPVIAISDFEQAETDRAQGQAAMAWQTAGLPFSEILHRNGYTDEQLSDILNARAGEIERDNAVTDIEVEQ